MSNRALTVDQYKEIMNEIWNNHRFGGLSRSIRQDDAQGKSVNT